MNMQSQSCIFPSMQENGIIVHGVIRMMQEWAAGQNCGFGWETIKMAGERVMNRNNMWSFDVREASADVGKDCGML